MPDAPVKVTLRERAARYRQCPSTLWLTGLSGAGKSTLATVLERRLFDLGHACHVIDGDAVRAGLSADLGFSPDHRRENVRRVAEVCRLMNDAGLIVIAALISPLRGDRALARSVVGPDHFIEVHVDADIAVCERRDAKGLYERARRGEIAEFTGVTAPYEVPESPELVLPTGRESVRECLQRMMAFLVASGRIGQQGD